MTDFNNLKNMSREDLFLLALKQGLKVHHKCGKATIIQAIMDSLQPQKPQNKIADETLHVGNPVFPDKSNDHDAVLEMLRGIQAKFPKLEYDLKGDVVSLLHRNKNGLVAMDESVNVNARLRDIRNVAEKVGRGPLSMRGMNHVFTEHVSNTYTNTVLS